MRLETRPEGCLSDYAIDRSLAGESSLADEAAASAHLGACPACRARRDALAKGRDAFTSSAPELVLPTAAWGSATRRYGRGKWATAMGAIALAAVLVLVARSRTTAVDAPTRAKGGAHVGFYVKRGDVVAQGHAGERVRPGDALRFVYSASQARYLGIVSLDGAGRASVYFPAGPRAERVEPAVERPLPLSTVLDAALGEEHVYALLCDAPIELEPVRAALETSGRAPRADGCEIDAMTLLKEAPRTP